MAAAEHWEWGPEETVSLAEQMARWSEQMATMPEGAPGYASWQQFLEYRQELRRSDRGEAPVGSCADISSDRDVQDGGESTTFDGLRIVHNIASILGLSR